MNELLIKYIAMTTNVSFEIAAKAFEQHGDATKAIRALQEVK